MKPMPLDNFINYQFLSNLQANPSHTLAAFVVKKANLENNGYDSNIYLTDGTKIRQLTALNKESGYFWLDDETILFNANRQQENKDEAMTSYYRINVHGGEAVFAFTLPFEVVKTEVITQKQLLILARYDFNQPNFYTFKEEKRKEILNTKKEEAYHTVIDEIPFWHNAIGFTNKQRKRLFIYDMESKDIQPITSAKFDCHVYHLDKKQEKIYLCGEKFTTKLKFKDEVYFYDLKTKTTERKLKNRNYYYHDFYVLNDTLVVEALDKNIKRLNQNPKFYRYDSVNDDLIVMSGEILLYNSLGSDVRLGSSANTLLKDQKLIYNTTVSDHSELYTLNEDFKIELLYQSKGAIDGFTIINDQLLTIELREIPQELYLGSQKISEFNHEALSDYYLAPIETFTFTSNGDNLTGYVLLPIDYHPDKTYPAILDIHGGPKTAYGPIYYHEMQYWASQGYFVFFTNPHGSSGVSDAFSNLKGKYGTIDYEDLMTLTDEVLTQYPAIDGERLGVTGGSYGGFMTNWIVTQTNRFKAAATQRSISNWLSFYGVADIGYYFTPDQNGAGIYEEADQKKLWHHSPLKYIKNAKTPTLIIHSEKDYRCPIDQGYQFFTGLIDQNVKARMVIFHEENHELSRGGKPQARIKRLTEISQWMDRFLK